MAKDTASDRELVHSHVRLRYTLMVISKSDEPQVDSMWELAFEIEPEPLSDIGDCTLFGKVIRMYRTESRWQLINHQIFLETLKEL